MTWNDWFESSYYNIPEMHIRNGEFIEHSEYGNLLQNGVVSVNDLIKEGVIYRFSWPS